MKKKGSIRGMVSDYFAEIINSKDSVLLVISFDYSDYFQIIFWLFFDYFLIIFLLLFMISDYFLIIFWLFLHILITSNQ